MKCPLSKNVLEEGSYPPGMEFRDCLKRDCAWWDNVLEDCSFRVAAKALDRLECVLQSIKEKIPNVRYTY